MVKTIIFLFCLLISFAFIIGGLVDWWQYRKVNKRRLREEQFSKDFLRSLKNYAEIYDLENGCSKGKEFYTWVRHKKLFPDVGYSGKANSEALKRADWIDGTPRKPSFYDKDLGSHV